MSLPLSLDDLKDPSLTHSFSCEAANLAWGRAELLYSRYRPEAKKHAKLAEWAHLLAVEALHLVNTVEYRDRHCQFEQSVRAYNAEFNPKAE
jgi:hypothetical protein